MSWHLKLTLRRYCTWFFPRKKHLHLFWGGGGVIACKPSTGDFGSWIKEYVRTKMKIQSLSTHQWSAQKGRGKNTVCSLHFRGHFSARLALSWFNQPRGQFNKFWLPRRHFSMRFFNNWATRGGDKTLVDLHVKAECQHYPWTTEVDGD